MTFLEIARQRRVRGGFETLDEGHRVINAQRSAQFESTNAFCSAFARLLGCPPAAFKKEAFLRATWIPTPLGDMLAVASPTHLHMLEFMDCKAVPTELAQLRKVMQCDIGIGVLPPFEQATAELDAFFAFQSAKFATPLAPCGTPFYKEVWQALRTVAVGQTRSYAEIARQIGRPTAMRAVARANGANPIPIMIPCHRVIGADGSLTGYSGGLWRKQRLLEIEQRFRHTIQCPD